MMAQVDLEDRLLRFVDTAGLEPLAAVSGVLVALVFGAAHALAPGHAKAVGAAYLVGERGRPVDALLLGVSVSAMHTFSVLVLGLLLYASSGSLEIVSGIGPGLRVASGAMVLGVGLWLVLRRLRRRELLRRTGHGHDHATDEPEGGAHAGVLAEGVSPFSRKGLVVLGMSGGILPSPSAFLVLVTALFAGRPGFGLTLVAAFSVGMAAALTIFGLAVVWGRGRIVARVEGSSALRRLERLLPLLGALGVVAGGTYLTVTGLMGL